MADIHVDVVDRAGKPVLGAIVLAQDTDAWFGKEYKGTTDERGKVTFGGVNAGVLGDHYRITARHQLPNGTIAVCQQMHQLDGPGLNDLDVRMVLTEEAAPLLGMPAIKGSTDKLVALETIGVLRKMLGRIQGQQQYQPAFRDGSKVPKFAVDAFVESVNSYLAGNTRLPVIGFAVSIELGLKEKHRQLEGGTWHGSMEDLIEWASKKNLVDRNDKQVGNLLRVMSNVYKHDYSEVDNTDPALAASMSLRVLNSIFT